MKAAQSLETPVHRFNQDGTAMLPTPHQMIFEAEYGTCILGVPTHAQSIQRA
jgi:hypothetical protein